MTLTPFHRLCVKFLVLSEPFLMLVKFPQSRGGCCFGPLDSRSGSRQFLIGEIDQIHKMDRISEVTSVGVFRQGCLHHEGRAFSCAALSPPSRACPKAWLFCDREAGGD